MAGEFIVGTLTTRLKMDANEFYRERERADKYIERTIKNLDHERRVLMWGAQGARDYGLQMSGASKERIAELNKLEAQVNSLRKAQESAFGGSTFGGLQGMFGKGSPLGQFLQILAGGGAIAGLGLLARSIESTSEKILKLAKTSELGTWTWDRYLINLANSVPILGAVSRAIENVGSIWGRRTNEEVIKAAEAFAQLRQSMQETYKAADDLAKGREANPAGAAFDAMISRVQAGKRAIIGSPDFEYGNPAAFEELRNLADAKRQLEAARAEAIQQDDEAIGARERWATFQQQEAERAAEILRLEGLRTLELQEQKQYAEEAAKAEEAWADRMNKRNRERLAKQTAATIARDNSPAEFDKALRQYASQMDRGAAVGLVEGSDARSIEAATRVAEHGVNREVDREIQRALLESNQRQAEEMAEIRKALINYIRDPDAGFRI